METLLTVTRKIRKCKSCQHNCEKELPIVGCESIMIPNPPGSIFPEYHTVCQKRVWFNSNYEPLDMWRLPTDEEFDRVTGKEWEAMLAEELKEIQMEVRQ